MRAYPLVGMPILAMLALFPGLQKARQRHIKYTQDKAAHWLDAVTDRRDLMSYILRHNDEKGMARAEIMETTGTLIIAGSETTATLLSGALFHLLKNPSSIITFVQEIRITFAESAVGVHQWSAYYSAANFALPDRFLPERWLDDNISDSRLASDKRSVVQPFSVGPRNCLGQHLAMAEMRAILARILWHFDINLCEGVAIGMSRKCSFRGRNRI